MVRERSCGGGADAARRRPDDVARHLPPPFGQRRPRRAAQVLVLHGGSGGHQTACRSARGRKTHGHTSTADADAPRIWRRRASCRRAAAGIGEPRCAENRDSFAPRIRRNGGVAGPHGIARRHGASRAARSGASHSLDWHRRGVCRTPARPRHQQQSNPRSPDRCPRLDAERARDSAVRVHRTEDRSERVRCAGCI